MKYADVVIDISSEKLDRCFSYKIPAEMQSLVKPGVMVMVPFGRSDTLRKGYITNITAQSRYEDDKLKEIDSVVTGMDTTESRLVFLASWMREHYGSTMIQALRTVFPVKQKIKAKEKRYLRLAVTEEEAGRILEELLQTRYAARIRFLKAVIDQAGKDIDAAEITKDFGISKSVMDYFAQKNIIEISSEKEVRNHFLTETGRESSICRLTEAQEAAVNAITEEWEGRDRPVLLYGVTGSGKTQVYMSLMEQVIREGKQAIVLIPEISLTYQTVNRFYERFGELVSVMNSRMSQGERYDRFRLAREGKIKIMIGPRSALFTPFENLGLIIIDEEHEPAYKSEKSPRYHARETAIERAALENAHVVLGSATPSLEAYSRAAGEIYRLVRLQGRYNEKALPDVVVTDLREELRNGNKSILSRRMEQELSECIAGGNQAMLFLNRRGYAGFVSCRSCGEVIKCPHCDVSMTEHGNGTLVCHYCGYTTAMPKRCPSCTSTYVGGMKAGTEQVERVLRKMLPEARVLRMDYDTTRTKGSYEKILSEFANHRADILVGTQMIVKGHDFPDVTLVGILAADMSLNESDFRCAERTYQLLVQAVGRAGRGEKPGIAVVQTYHPEHYSIRAALCQDYESFYKEEMAFRTLMNYPPYAGMLAVMGAYKEEQRLSMAMEYIGKFIKRIYQAGDIAVIGPAMASVSRIKDVYHEVLYVKHYDKDVLIEIKDKLEQYIEINTGFKDIYIQFDIS